MFRIVLNSICPSSRADFSLGKEASFLLPVAVENQIRSADIQPANVLLEIAKMPLECSRMVWEGGKPFWIGKMPPEVSNTTVSSGKTSEEIEYRVLKLSTAAFWAN
jgi:hypothetical protein